MWDRTEDQVEGHAEKQTELILIRHGATNSNRMHRYVGRTDEPLSREGIAGLLAAKRAGVYPAVDRLFTSPMKRCVGTAELLYPGMCPTVIPEWREMDFGIFEGKSYLELKDDRRYQEWIDSGGTLPFPEGESREAFSLRCERGFCRMLGLLSPEEGFGAAADTSLRPVSGDTPPCPAGGDGNGCGCGRIGLVVHGGTIMVLLSRYAGGDYFAYQVPNGDGYRCLLGRQPRGKSVGRKELRLTGVKRLGS